MYNFFFFDFLFVKFKCIVEKELVLLLGNDFIVDFILDLESYVKMKYNVGGYLIILGNI